MVYVALPQEVQTCQIITRARLLCKQIAVPVVRGVQLLTVELSSDPSQMQRNALGVLEPRPPYRFIPLEALGCVLIPGVAFDTLGGRLGFGKGYYDRFLALLPETTYRCGLAFSLQMVPCVPQDPHDIRMHGMITEQGHRPCQTLPPSLPSRGSLAQ